MGILSKTDLSRDTREPASNDGIVAANVLLIILVISENLFCLIDVSQINIAGIINFDLLWQIGLFVSSLYLNIKSHMFRREEVSHFETLLLLALASLCFMASWRCEVLTGQPFIRGLLPQRGFLVLCLSSALLRRPLKVGLINVRRLILGIVFLGSISSILYLLQIVLGSSVVFIHASAGERYGGMRLYVSSGLSIVAGIVSFWLFLRFNKWTFIVPTLLTFCVMLFVTKGRLELLVLVLVLTFFLFAERGSVDKKVLLICLTVFAVILLSTTEYGSKIFESFINSRVGGSEDTSTIRSAGRQWYEMNLHSVDFGQLFGCGYPSSLYAPASAMAGFDLHYYLVDNGIWAFRYVYGGLGITLLTTLIISLLLRCISDRNPSLKIPIIGFFLFLILPMQNLAWWWWSADWQVLTAIFIGLSYFRSDSLFAKDSID